ncbi:hypothetical protein [Enterococcus italicus]|uniref:hypothetical protein n=1 Tax=Enterococcus italicus TaxID=246144 RepID=UPI003F455C99
MKSVLINFADENYKKAQKFNSFTGKYIAHFDEIKEFSPKDIDVEFIKKNQSIFSYQRGFGLWIWKPYLINKVLDELDDGDILFYSDSGSFFIKKIDSLIKSMNEDDIWLYGLPLIEKEYTKPYTFKHMICESTKYRDTNQFSGTFAMFRVTEKSRNFVKEWLSFCEEEEVISPDEGIGYIHREDQSILSLLAKKNNLNMHTDPSQYGNIPEKYYQEGRIFKKIMSDNDRYKAVLVHHRTGNMKFSVCARQYLCAVLPRNVGLCLISKKSKFRND